MWVSVLSDRKIEIRKVLNPFRLIGTSKNF